MRAREQSLPAQRPTRRTSTPYAGLQKRPDGKYASEKVRAASGSHKLVPDPEWESMYLQAVVGKVLYDLDGCLPKKAIPTPQTLVVFVKRYALGQLRNARACSGALDTAIAVCRKAVPSWVCAAKCVWWFA